MGYSFGNRRGGRPVKCHVRTVRLGSGEAKDWEAEVKREAERWARIAPRKGFCNCCGATVDEENGRLHDEGCIPSQPERCRKGQRT